LCPETLRARSLLLQLHVRSHLHAVVATPDSDITLFPATTTRSYLG
jgi:hypothetical protein